MTTSNAFLLSEQASYEVALQLIDPPLIPHDIQPLPRRSLMPVSGTLQEEA